MKLLNLYPTKRAVLATTAVLAASILSLLPWRLIAQPSFNAPPSGATASRGARGRGGSSGIRSGGFSGEIGGPSISTRSSTRPPANVAPARFEATIYELTVPDNRIADLDAVKLESEAGTPGKPAAFLGGFGPVRIPGGRSHRRGLAGELVEGIHWLGQKVDLWIHGWPTTGCAAIKNATFWQLAHYT